MIYTPRDGPAGLEAERSIILDAQKKMISVAQARALGMSAGELRWKVDRREWQRIYRGVYATFSGDLTRGQKLWAVVLRIGQDAVLSHETAAELHGFASGNTGAIHVTVPVSRHPARWQDLHGVVIHRPACYRADPQPYWQLPRTPVAETVLDLVAVARTPDDAYAWLSRAVANGAVTTAMLSAALAERKKFRGRAWLTEALTDVSDGVHFPLERRWKRDVERAHGFPAATRQVRRKGADGVRFLDNLYDPWGICVELDGLAFHMPEGLARDRRRDNETLIGKDVVTLRYGFPEVANRPCEQAEQFARALIRRGWQAGSLRACGPACRVGTLVGLRRASGKSPHDR